MLTYRIGVLMTLAPRSHPTAADWLNQDRPHDERGDVTVQNVIWIAIAAAGAFVIAVVLYNKFRTKATNLDVDNPGVLPADSISTHDDQQSTAHERPDAG